MGCGGSKKTQAEMTFGADAPRGCSDCWCIPVWFIACVVQALVAWVAMHNGHPKHLIFGTDYQGDLCGSSDPFDSPHTDLHHGLDGDWSEYKYLWYPVDMKVLFGSNGDAIKGASDVWTKAAKNAVCVKKCPSKGDTVYTYGQAKDGTNGPYSYDVGYDSIATLRRCLPTSLPVGIAAREGGAIEMRMEPVRWEERVIDKTTARGAVAPTGAVDRAASAYDSGLGAWMCTSPSALCVNVPPGTYGAVEDQSQCEEQCSASQGAGGLALNIATQTMADVYESLPVVGYCAILALVMGAVWLILMRHSAYVIICISLVIIFSFLGGIGWILYAHAPAADTPKYWYWASYTVWGVDGILMLFFLIFRRTIKTAALVIMESCEVMLSSLRTLFIPIGTALVSVVFTLFCALVYIYIESMKKAELPGELGFIDDETKGQASGWVTTDAERTIKFMWWWNVFFYFWGSCFIGDFAYMVLAIIGVFWYYSAPSMEHQEKEGIPEEDRQEKEAPGICKAVSTALFHHVGTLAVGSFIVAVIKLIRFIFLKMKEQFEKRLGKNAARVVVCLIECLLWCIEKIVQAVTRRSYIMTAITGDGFFPSAWAALSLMISNAVLVVATEFIEASTAVIGKVLIMSFAVGFCYMAIEWWHMVPDGTQIWGPLLACAIASYTIASIFMNVFGTITSTILVTFMYDNDDQSDGDVYMPAALRNTVGKIEAHGKEKPPFKKGDVLRLRHPRDGIRLGRQGQDLRISGEHEDAQNATFTVCELEPMFEVQVTNVAKAGHESLPYVASYNNGHAPSYAFMPESQERECKWYDPCLIIIFPFRLVLCLLTCGRVPCLDPFGGEDSDDEDEGKGGDYGTLKA
eukprot:Hpha_TRINITY_DN15693_c1_g6::TRINITY_DN15693_c1_g6_i1::g.99343::m.99343/K15377/SLC44A2_4_5; solute carrier family 44 (choline transporter-like protein), member 2/4/5